MWNIIPTPNNLQKNITIFTEMKSAKCYIIFSKHTACPESVVSLKIKLIVLYVSVDAEPASTYVN